MSFRFVFDPLSGRFEVRQTTAQGGGGSGGTIAFGTLTIPDGAVIIFENDLQLGESGEILVEENADLLIAG